MAEKKAPDNDETEQALPPADDPLGRHGADPDGIGSVEAAMLRVEALRRSRLMPADDQPPPRKK
jgi:hypothetical protein